MIDDNFNEVETGQEIKILLQISKSFIINDNTTILDIKHLILERFSKYCNDFNIYVNEYDISTLDNLNAKTTMNYYKSNTIHVIPKLTIEDNSINENNQEPEGFNESKSQGIFNINENSKVYQKFPTPEEIANRSLAYLNKNNKEFEFHDNHSHSNFKSQDNFSSLMSPLKQSENDMKNFMGKLENERRERPYINNQNSKLNFNSQMSTQFQNTENLNKINENNKFEVENFYITNRILNKSNLEFKAKIRELEAIIEADKENKFKIEEMQQFIENLEKINSEYENKLKEIVNDNESILEKYEKLIFENNQLLSQIEILNRDKESYEKSKNEFKLQLESIDVLSFSHENMKKLMNENLNEKDRFNAELVEKIRSLNELNISTRKRCNDYEDMLNGIQKTIDIIKKSNKEKDEEIIKLSLDNEDLKKDKEKKDKFIENLNEKNKKLQCELVLLTSNLNDEELNTMRKQDAYIQSESKAQRNNEEIELMRSKLENLNLILLEKDKVIESSKNSLNIVNRNLEETKLEVEDLKHKFNEKLIEVKASERLKESFEYQLNELSRKNNETSKLIENLYRQNLALEEDNSDLRQRLAMKNEEINSTFQSNELFIEIRKLKESLNELELEKYNLEKEKMRLNEKLVENDSLIDMYRININKNKSEFENLQLRLKTQEILNENLQKSKENLTNEINSLQEKVHTLFNEKNKYRQNSMEKDGVIHLNQMNYNKEIENLKADIESKDNFILELNEKCSNIENQLNLERNEKQKNSNSKDKIIDKLKDDFNEIQSKLINSKIELEELNNIITIKNKSIENLEKTLNDLSESNSKMKNNIEILTNSNKDLLAKYENFKSNLNSNDGKFSQKFEKLNKIIEDKNKEIKELNDKNSMMQSELISFKENASRLEKSNRDIQQRFQLYTEISQNSSVHSRNFNPNLNLKNSDISSIRENTDNKNKSYETSENKSDRNTIIDGATVIFTVFDNRRLLRFDIESKSFKLIEFADFGEFEKHYNPQGSIYLNIQGGLLILSGDNNDQFFHYNHKKKSITKQAKLKYNHSHGSLIYNEFNNSVLCISGWHCKSVEKYENDDILSNFLKKGKLNRSEKQNKNTWISLPDLTVERSEASFLIQDSYIYGFFGFNCPQMKYLDSIERLNLNNGVMWEIVLYSNKSNSSTYRKSFSIVNFNENEILFIGGFNGKDETPVENFSKFNIRTNEFIETEIKFPDLTKNLIYNFQNNNVCSPFIDGSNQLNFICFDSKELVHIIRVENLEHKIYASLD